ncbi:hypothetical protein [Pedobacter paludis]|uniref:Uncharacterized protein n=1 Tax=Pedobacter paludis TaxID=2203212 RepID=A0A317ETN1_9SPHI|nr:hypothetical protein [Pedobacter paludis]PWS30310.1 hypothetical protein DF947_17915 [Pedobacter paludis]
MEHLPIYVYLTFGITVVIAIWLFYRATNYSRTFLTALLLWILLQSILAISGFYKDPNTLTERFPLLIVPPLLFLISRLVTKSGRTFLDGLNLPTLTVFHVIRIPVELVLFWLYLSKGVPEAMTFHGRNFDVFSGISAPFIYYFGFVNKKLNKWVIITWNLVCLALLLNVVSSAILSLPARFVLFGFEQPNVALGYFPFILLPAVLVPLVLLSTVATIRQLLKMPFGS